MKLPSQCSLQVKQYQAVSLSVRLHVEGHLQLDAFTLNLKLINN